MTRINRVWLDEAFCFYTRNRHIVHTTSHTPAFQIQPRMGLQAKFSILSRLSFHGPHVYQGPRRAVGTSLEFFNPGGYRPGISWSRYVLFYSYFSIYFGSTLAAGMGCNSWTLSYAHLGRACCFRWVLPSDQKSTGSSRPSNPNSSSLSAIPISGEIHGIGRE